MLKRVVITNYLGESMEYRIDGVEAENPSGLIITSIDGLGPVKANINMTELTTTDGQMYNSARLSGRNIVIKGLFTHVSSIEEARLLSYKYFPIKKKLKVRVETDKRIGETEGYVESNEPDIFSEQSGCQISILCENPYFDGGKIGYTFGDTVPLFKFQFGNEELDEPLIKLSEAVDVTDVREIVYEGDVDTGMEIVVEAPTDDVMDTFNVTGIEILGDNNKKISIDTSKFVNQVPDTGSNFSTYYGVFISDGTKYKVFDVLPTEAYGYAYPARYESLIYENELHAFNRYTLMGQDAKPINYHVAWPTPDSNMVIYPFATNTTDWFVGNETGIQNLNGTIYNFHFSLDFSSRQWIHRYDPISNEWILSYADHGATTRKYTAFVCVVFNNLIHIFDSSYDEGTYQNYPSNGHTAWDGENLEVVEYLNRTSPTLFPNNPDDYFSFEKSRIIVYDNKIHVFGGGDYYKRIHYTWDGETWVSLNDRLPYDVDEDVSVAVYKNKLHFYYRTDRDMTKDYIYEPSTNTWVESDPLPFEFSGYPIEFSGYLFFVSNEYSGYYRGTPNNDHLMENDKLVINTIKGKKGVTLYRGTDKYNVLNSLDKDSTWLQLQRGVNRFSYDAATDADKLQITIQTNKWYEGV